MKLFETDTVDAPEHDGDQYFDQAELASVTRQNDKSRDKLIHMDPADFLKVAMSGYNDEKQARVNNAIAQGSPLSDIPFLSFVHDGEGVAVVTGHEGRHRARALMARGVKSMPVVLRHVYDGNGQTIRWGSVNGNSFDRYGDEWPHTLYGQRGDDPESNQHRHNKMPFPVRREDL